MKCYFGGSRYPSEYDYNVACFATNVKEAKKLMWDSGELAEVCDGLWIDAGVWRKPDFDRLYDQSKGGPYIIRDTHTLRLMGWKCDGDEICDSCELYEMDGDYSVCGDCNWCDECGHHPDCKNKYNG